MADMRPDDDSRTSSIVKGPAGGDQEKGTHTQGSAPRGRRWLRILLPVVAVVLVALILAIAIPLGIRHNQQSSSPATANANASSSASPSPSLLSNGSITADSSSAPSQTAAAKSQNQSPGRSVATFAKGPAFNGNFADPAVIEVNGKFHAFATNKFVKAEQGQVNIQMATSDDFSTWSLSPHDALPKVGEWSTGDYVWAPDVVRLDNGNFVMYYSARHNASSNHHCVGAATSKTIEGPYAPQRTPIVCPLNEGGAIDPDGFRDGDGKRYLVYKVDGNSLNKATHSINPTPIMLQEVDPKDGLTFIGGPTEILNRDASDGPLVEAPSLMKYSNAAGNGVVYVLFFSSNIFTTDFYNVKYATSTAGIKGPYTRSGSPLLVSGDQGGKLFGPGGLDVGADGSRVVFHSGANQNAKTRELWTGQIAVSGTTVTI